MNYRGNFFGNLFSDLFEIFFWQFAWKLVRQFFSIFFLKMSSFRNIFDHTFGDIFKNSFRNSFVNRFENLSDSIFNFFWESFENCFNESWFGNFSCTVSWNRPFIFFYFDGNFFNNSDWILVHFQRNRLWNFEKKKNRGNYEKIAIYILSDSLIKEFAWKMFNKIYKWNSRGINKKKSL